jgi:hypothetical protein
MVLLSDRRTFIAIALVPLLSGILYETAHLEWYVFATSEVNNDPPSPWSSSGVSGLVVTWQHWSPYARHNSFLDKTNYVGELC